ncbi:MAG: transposase [bacterium]|nr:transposase [bacterium]
MSYQTDLTDREWNLIRHHFEYENGYGNRRKHPIRTMLNAIFYVAKTGCQWRMLPKDFPPWTSVYTYYRRLCQRGTWEQVLDELNRLHRVQQGLSESPSFAIVDSQSVKSAGKGSKRGFDGGKK